MPMISVIVPVYKVEQYLRRCVDSVLAQTYTDYELILVDDGSPDNSGAICDEYAARDARVRVIHKENGGVSSARNAGLDAAKGEHITFLDADDAIAPAFLEHGVSAVRQFRCELYAAGYARVHPDGSELYKSQIPGTVAVVDKKLSVDDFVLLLKKSYISSAWKILYSRALIGDLRFDSGLSFGEDLKFTWMVLQKTPRLFATPEIGYYYTVNAESATSVPSRKKNEGILSIYRFIFDFDRQYWGQEEAMYQNYCRCRWRMDYLATVFQIWDSRLPLLTKLSMFRFLYRDRDLRCALYAGETHCCPFFYDPCYQVLKRKLRDLSKKTKHTLAKNRRL